MKKYLVWDSLVGYYTEGFVDISKIISVYKCYDKDFEYVKLLTDNGSINVYFSENSDDSGIEAQFVYELFRKKIAGLPQKMYMDRFGDDDIGIEIKEVE